MHTYIHAASGARTPIQAIRAAHPSMSIPPGADLLALGYEAVMHTAMPALAPGESAAPGPLEREGSGWRETWTVLPPPAAEAVIAAKIDFLWSAADRYTASFISGVAVGILAMGVMQRLPKCLAVAAWSGSVWAEYYRRKSLVTADSADDHDFSNFGPMPFSVPDLQAEVGM